MNAFRENGSPPKKTALKQEIASLNSSISKYDSNLEGVVTISSGLCFLISLIRFTIFFTSKSLAKINLMPFVNPVKISCKDMLNEIVAVLNMLL